MKYPKINGKQLSAKNKLKFAYTRNSIKESLAFDNDEFSCGLKDKDIDLLSWNAAYNCLAASLSEFNHLN